MAREEPFTVEAVYLTETEKAVLVDVAGDEAWVPLSQIEEGSQICGGCGFYRGDVGELVVARWLARKRGWE